MNTILIIDDEEDLCALLKTALARENYVVDCAYTLNEAEGKLNKHFRVVLLDNNMPDGTGLEFIQLHPVQFMESFVIMITADSNPTLELKARQEGIDAFIQKPFSIRSVRDLIRQVA